MNTEEAHALLNDVTEGQRIYAEGGLYDLPPGWSTWTKRGWKMARAEDLVRMETENEND